MFVPTKIIWSYWHQGWDNAPEVVRRCRASWERANPEYSFRFLDQESVTKRITIPETFRIPGSRLPIQKISNFIRLALLAEYGGVWVDATLYCQTPLREWLALEGETAFFAFQKPGKAKIISNWFFAAEPESVILQNIVNVYVDYFANNTFVASERYRYVIEQVLAPFWDKDIRSTLNWLSFFPRKILRMYPYSIFHYLFNWLMLTNPGCASLFAEMPYVSAKPSLLLLNHSRAGVDPATTIQILRAKKVCVYKLNWRTNYQSSYWMPILEHLS
jgi:hypothetical protein